MAKGADKRAVGFIVHARQTFVFARKTFLRKSLTITRVVYIILFVRFLCDVK